MKLNRKKIIIGSRASPLAKKQVEIFIDTLKKKFKEIKEYEFLNKYIKTSGDKYKYTLSEVGNKGLFTKEIDEAQLNKKIDISVHSLKDLPFNLPKGLKIGAFLKREDHRDALVSSESSSIKDLKRNAIIGTSSIRREVQLKKIRTDIKLKIIRGNIQTRVKKVLNGSFDATFLAMAGLNRLRIKNNIYPIGINEFIPAPGQGVIVILHREDDLNSIRFLKKINHKKTFLEASCEREFLGALDGSCETPIGAVAFLKKNKTSEKIYFNYFVSNNGSFYTKKKKVFDVKNCLYECKKLAKEIKEKLKG